ncbi:uncharacterized protein [Hoplias malabaricus]|uniref:uncharacterized protein n=1 Tax=Hoplias malabaricus TaxID=27720 RepID=UPI003462793E
MKQKTSLNQLHLRLTHNPPRKEHTPDETIQAALLDLQMTEDQMENRSPGRSSSPSRESAASGWSADRLIEFKGGKNPEDQRRGPRRSDSRSGTSGYSTASGTVSVDVLSVQDSGVDSAVSVRTDWSREAPPSLRSDDPRENQENPAEPGQVACDLCEGIKLKASKSCLTCLASFCTTHVQDHHTAPALQRHLLVEVTKSLDVLLEMAHLKKALEEERRENAALRQKICALRLPDYIRTGKTLTAADVVLDPATAHCSLVLCDGGKGVRLGERRAADNGAERFDKYECVVSTQGFSSGRHHWEVEVNREFTLGVCRHSAPRRGRFTFSPSVGYWCLYHYRQSFTALEDPSRHLPLETLPRVLGVCLDVDEKWVTFYNSETKACIYTFRRMEFRNGERIYALFETSSKSQDLKIKAVG